MLHSTYNLGLVALSVFIATLASHTTLNLASQVRLGKKQRIGWLVGGALAMGTGIWSMHFIGMLAFHLEIPIGYNLPLLLLSFIVPILGSSWALKLLSQAVLTGQEIFFNGIIFAFAITSMHYLGMMAMRMSAVIDYNLLLVGLSFIIACGASWAALWLGLRMRATGIWNWKKLVSAIFMGCGISIMHYTGMAAAHFHPAYQVRVDPWAIDTRYLPVAISFGALLILGLTLFSTGLDRRIGATKKALESLQTFIREMQVGVLFFDSDLKLLLSNPYALKLLNLSAQQLSEQTAFESSWQLSNAEGIPLTPDNNPVRQSRDAHRPVLNLVLGYQNSSPEQRWLLFNANPLKTPQGELEGVLCTFMDISEQKQTQIALEKSEAKFQKMATNIPGMIYQFCLKKDGEFSFPFVSSGCSELFKLEPKAIQENVGLFLAGFDAEDLPQLRESLALSASTLEPWFWQGRYHTLQGQIIWLQAVGRPEKQLNEDIVWDGVFIDITDRKKAEEEALKQTILAQLLADISLKIRDSLDINKILNVTVEEVLHILQADRVLIYQFSPNRSIKVRAEARKTGQNRITTENMEPLIEEIYNQEYQEDKIRVISDVQVAKISPIYREFLEKFAVKSKLIVPIIEDAEVSRNCEFEAGKSTTKHHLWGLLIAHQCSHNRDWSNFEIDLMGKLANQLSLAIAKAELIAKERKVSQRMAQQNVALEKIVKELKQAQTQLVQHEKMASLGQLVAGVAHEINNPVSFIAGNVNYANTYVQKLLELLNLYAQHSPQPSEDIQKVAEEIDLEFIREDLPKILSSMAVGAERIRKIVVSLRNFSRLDQAEKKLVDIHEGIESTLLILQHRVKESVEVIKDYAILPLVECYPGQLNEVFMNILSNALDAVEIQNKTKKIVIKTEVVNYSEFHCHLNPKVRICIKDNGPGIPQSIQKRIFDPFFTTKSPGKGTGLGLSISYQIIVERHQGQLFCRSFPGEGTEFIIEIPIRLEREKTAD